MIPLVLEKFGNGRIDEFYQRLLVEHKCGAYDYMRGLQSATDKEIRAAFKIAAKKAKAKSREV
jgi:hypothetical protein